MLHCLLLGSFVIVLKLITITNIFFTSLKLYNSTILFLYYTGSVLDTHTHTHAHWEAFCRAFTNSCLKATSQCVINHPLIAPYFAQETPTLRWASDVCKN